MKTAKTVLLEAESKVAALRVLLDQEFDYLKNDNLDQLGQLQDEKINILSELAALRESGEQYFESDHQTTSEYGTQWNNVLDSVVKCKAQHLRNETFVSRRLDSIRAALSVLRSGDVDTCLNLYDKRGGVTRKTT